MTKQIKHIDEPQAGDSRSFARGTSAGGFLFVSGISAGESGSATEEARMALGKMKEFLEDSGSAMNQVVHVTLLINNPQDYPEINAEYVNHFPDGLPSRNTVRIGVPTTAKCAFSCFAFTGSTQ